MVPDRRHKVQLVPPHPGPGCPLAPWRGMVRRFSQGHGDGHPLMSQPWSGAVAPAANVRLPQRCQHDCSTSRSLHEVTEKKETLEWKLGLLWLLCFFWVGRC